MTDNHATRFSQVMGSHRVTGQPAGPVELTDPGLIGPAQFPDSPLATPYGTLTNTPLAADFVAIAGTVHVNGIDFQVNASLSSSSGENWEDARRSLNVQRANVNVMAFNFAEHPGAQEKVRAVVFPSVAFPSALAWVEAHPDQMALAVRAERRQRYDQAQLELDQAQLELADARAKLDARIAAVEAVVIEAVDVEDR